MLSKVYFLIDDKHVSRVHQHVNALNERVRHVLLHRENHQLCVHALRGYEFPRDVLLLHQ